MSHLVESIKIYNGKIYNLGLHEARLNRSRMELFGCAHVIRLRKMIEIPDDHKFGLVKCRVEYSEDVTEITFNHYNVRNIQTVKVVESSKLDYSHKWVERVALDNLYQKRHHCDEIMIIQNGLVTDAYYYNLIFEKNNSLYTPSTPLLHGVQREKLLAKGRVGVLEIPISAILNFDKIHFINALTPMGHIVIDTDKVVF